MVIEINLHNIKQCNGCPCLCLDFHQYPCMCHMGYWKDEYEKYRDEDSIFERPQICIDNHGG